MGCCDGGKEPERTPEGLVKDRKCRDVLCFLLFFVFWIGMFIVCGVAYKNGDLRRLIYGVDSYGMTCGVVNTMNFDLNTSIGKLDATVTFDFSNKKSLYYLNPLELLSLESLPYAKAVCLDTCPDTPNVCGPDSIPCTAANTFRCNYAALAQYDLAGEIPGVTFSDTAYYHNLSLVAGRRDNSSASFINSLRSLNVAWINNWLASNNITAGGNVSGSYYQLTSQFPNKGPCNPVYAPTTNFFNRCLPRYSSNFTDGLVQVVGNAINKLPADVKDAFNSAWNSWNARFARAASDIEKGVLIIVVGGLIASLVLSAMWLVILRYLAGVMAWLTLILVNVALLGVTLYCFSLAGFLGTSTWAQDVRGKLSELGNPMAIDQQAWEAIAIVAAIVTVVIFILTMLMISRVKVAVACIKVASQAVGHMPSIMFFPLFPFVLEVILVVYWVAVSAMLYTAGTLTASCRSASSFMPFTISSIGGVPAESLLPTFNASVFSGSPCYSDLSGQQLQVACGNDPNCNLSYKWNDALRYAFIYHFFGLLWTNQVIIGIACVTIAGAIGTFYWTGGDPKRMPALPVVLGMRYAFVHSIGSICFASIILALLQFIRLILEFLDRQLSSLQSANKCAEWAMYCCKCCLWCLEKIVAFINRNAYVVMAIRGTSYCDSAITAVKLIVSNALRLVTVTIIGDVLLWLGKLSVCACCALISFAMSTLPYYSDPIKYPETYLSSPVWPIVISSISGFVIASIFFSVYEMAIDTIMLSFCADCDANGGNPKWAPPLLLEAVGQDALRRDKPVPPGQHQQPGAGGKGNAVAPAPAPKQHSAFPGQSAPAGGYPGGNLMGGYPAQHPGFPGAQQHAPAPAQWPAAQPMHR